MRLVDARNELGTFLRARRELVQPEDVGLPRGATRKVHGLRREEVAALAGISSEYYLRLERGRDTHPSDQVLDALARVLQLDHESRGYLLDLARARPSSPPAEGDRLPADAQLLLDTIGAPAFIVNRYRDVLAANAAATELSPMMRPGVNRIRALFLDAETQRAHPDWEQHAASMVAQLRADLGTRTDDPRAQTLIGELTMKSSLFRTLWDRHDVGRGGRSDTLIVRPGRPPLAFRQEKLQLVADPALLLVVYLPQTAPSDVPPADSGEGLSGCRAWPET
ncbi:transcriptional regulator [Cnuibacter physcomitrellae]|nr:transcriptional regulator [Cnuibacter physcomitrellae]